MKSILIVFFLVLSQITFAQFTIKTEDFNVVKIFDNLQVKLIPFSENKIVIFGNRKMEVEILNKKGVLKLKMPNPILKSLSGDNITINLFYKNIQSIQASEGSYVFSDTTFKQNAIKLNATSGAEINLNLDVDRASIRAFSGGILELSGNAKNQNDNVFFGGNLKASKLQTSQSKIIAYAGGKAEIYSSLFVDADAKTGGSIFIYGKPKQINKQTILGGTIIEK